VHSRRSIAANSWMQAPLRSLGFTLVQVSEIRVAS